MLNTSCTCTKADISLNDCRYSVTLPQNPHYNPCSSVISVKVNAYPANMENGVSS